MDTSRAAVSWSYSSPSAPTKMVLLSNDGPATRLGWPGHDAAGRGLGGCWGLTTRIFRGKCDWIAQLGVVLHDVPCQKSFDTTVSAADRAAYQPRHSVTAMAMYRVRPTAPRLHPPRRRPARHYPSVGEPHQFTRAEKAHARIFSPEPLQLAGETRSRKQEVEMATPAIAVIRAAARREP